MPVLPGGAPLNIADGIREQRRARPLDIAVVDGDRQLNFRALDERSSRLACLLLAAGLVRGERVAVLLGNRLEYLEVAAGCAKAGLVMVPLNPRLTGPEAEFILGHSGSKALVVDDALAATVADQPGASAVEVVFSIDGTSVGPSYEQSLAGARAVDPAVRVHETEPFTVCYTAGTTGQPKGVAISHRSRTLTFYCAALEWGLGVGRRTIAVAPMYHGAGFAYAYGAVFTGGTVSMMRSYDPEVLLGRLRSFAPSSVFLVPTHAQMLRSLDDGALRDAGATELSTLFFNAAPLPQPLKEWVIDSLPGCGVHELYGSTEAGIVTDLRPADVSRKRNCVGVPWFMTEVRVVDDDGRPVGPGEHGELYSRSPYLMNGYLDDPAATAACTTPDGFLTSGDVAVVDDEGFIYIVDRKKDMILTGGVNVYPREVEDVLLRHPSVQEVAVVGVPSETWGEQVVAFVVVTPGSRLMDAELDGHARASLASYKVPRAWTEVGALPRSNAGKVLKRELRAGAAAVDG